MIEKGSIVSWNGNQGTVIQIDPTGRAVVRFDSGLARPLRVSELTESGGSSNPSNPVSLPHSQSSLTALARKDPKLQALVQDLQAWTVADGFGFHRLLKQCLEVGAVDYSNIGQGYNTTHSTVRNWSEGRQRPPISVQKDLIRHLISETIARMESMDEEVEAAEVEAADAADAGEAQRNASRAPEASEEEQVAPPERRSIEAGGFSFTLSVYPSKGEWIGVVEELPLEAKGSSKVEVVMDLKSLIHNHLLKQSSSPAELESDTIVP